MIAFLSDVLHAARTHQIDAAILVTFDGLATYQTVSLGCDPRTQEVAAHAGAAISRQLADLMQSACARAMDGQP